MADAKRNPNVKKSEDDIIREKHDRLMQTVNERASYYRANPHRFVSEYFQITLKLFQQIILFLMDKMNCFMYVAARSQGKTFLIAVYCCVRCILYPGTKIVVASKTRSQAREVLEKIKTVLVPMSETLKSEINWRDVADSQNDTHIGFKNHSVISVVSSNENARHSRAHILIVDEFRLVNRAVLDTVLRRFLGDPRHPPYLDNPIYREKQEINKQIYATSSWYKSEWWYEKAKSFFENMIGGKRKYAICALPYQLSYKEGLLMKEQLEDEMSDTTFDPVAWSMEMECLPFSDTDGAFYSYSEIARNRKIPHPWLPSSEAHGLLDKRIKIPPKGQDLRIMSVDLALLASTKKKDNDATFICINQTSNTLAGRVVNNIVYVKSMEGVHALDQALIIRQLFEEFSCDYLVVDYTGIGAPIVDILLREQADTSTGQIYPAMSCCNNEDVAARCVDPYAKKCIWAINGSARFNSECALGLRESFRQGLVRLLISEYDGEEALSPIVGYSKLAPTERADIKVPYIQTSLLTNELINLQYEVNNNVLRVSEKSGMRKDRYCSLAYNVYVSRALENSAYNKGKRTNLGVPTFKFKKPVDRR